MVLGQRLAVIIGSNKSLVTQKIDEPQVRGVVPVRAGLNISRFRRRPDQIDQGLDRYAPPASIELRPAGHAMDIHCELLLRQGRQTLPIQRKRSGNFTIERQRPAVLAGRDGGACRHHRKLARHHLIGWQTRTPVLEIFGHCRGPGSKHLVDSQFSAAEFAGLARPLALERRIDRRGL